MTFRVSNSLYGAGDPKKHIAINVNSRERLWFLKYNLIIGTYVLVLFGTGSIAQSVLSLGHKGDFFSINWG